MKTKKFVVEIVTTTLLIAGISTPVFAQADNLQGNQLRNANNSKEQLKQNNSASVNTTDIANDLIPAPTQHFGKPDGKLPEVETSISYETENSDANRTDGDRTDANQNGSNQTGKILRPGSKLTLHATARFTVPKKGEVFRPYLRIAIPKILTVKASDFNVNVGGVASKVVALPNSSTFAKYNLFDVYFNYKEWSSDFANEMPNLAKVMPKLADEIGEGETPNVLDANGGVLANNQQVTISINAAVDNKASVADLIDLQNYKKGVKPAIQGRVSYMPSTEAIKYNSAVGGLNYFPDDGILKSHPCLIRSDLETGWKGQGDYGFWFTGLAMETSGVDYEGRHTAVRSLKNYTFNQLIPANLKYNQIVTIRRNDSDNNPIILKLKMPAASEGYASNSTKQEFSNGNLTVFRWPNTNNEALNLMENAGIDKVQYDGGKVFGDTLPEKSFEDWGTYGSQNRPAELFVSGVFNSKPAVFGPDDISKGIWLQGNSKASITTYYKAPSCNRAYSDEELAYPPIISKIQETVAAYARSNRSKVSTVPIEIVIPASLSGRVWFDANKNGIQDSNEQSVPGAKVELVGEYNQKILDIDGKTIEAVTTGSDGSYKFTNLNSGKYKVKFTIPDGGKYVGFTTANQGGDDTRDSDAIPGEPTTDRSAGAQDGVGTGSADSNSKEANVSNINIPEGGNKKNVDAGVIAKDEAPKDPKSKDPKPKQPEPKPNPKDPEPKPKPEPQPKEPKTPEPKNPDPKTPEPKNPHGQDREPNPEPETPPHPKNPEPNPQPEPQPKNPEPEPQPQPEPKDPEPKNPPENVTPPDTKIPPDTKVPPETNVPPETMIPPDTDTNVPPETMIPPDTDTKIPPETKVPPETDTENPPESEELETNSKQKDTMRTTVSKLAKTGVNTVLVAVFALAMFAVGVVKGFVFRTSKGRHRQ